jgi:hypothetical protein
MVCKSIKQEREPEVKDGLNFIVGNIFLWSEDNGVMENI